MQKLTLLSVLAVLCLLCNTGTCQNTDIIPFQIGERVPDLPLKNIINYKDSTATFSSFDDKLIIIDFWHTRCGACIAMFPKMDSLQQLYHDKIQFILVTAENKQDASSFLKNWNSRHQKQLSIPIIANDNLLHKLFRHRYNPHYVWLAPDGEMMAQTGFEFVNSTFVELIIHSLVRYRMRLKNEEYAPEFFKYPPLTESLKIIINQN